MKAGGWRRSSATAALAWNNLLSFVYIKWLLGFDLDQLVARHGFTRVALEVETLMTLSDQQTTLWGVWEERVVKFSCRVLAGNGMLFPSL